MNPNHIEILVGMIASGKSTYARRQAQKGAIIINDDALVTAIHGGDYSLYTKTLKPLYKGLMANLAHLAILANRHVIIDIGLNRSKTSRKKWLAMAASVDALATATIFQKLPAEPHAARRFDSDAREKCTNCPRYATLWLSRLNQALKHETNRPHDHGP